jgi:hypothetical protein
MMFVISSLSFAQIDKIAIFYEQVGWIGADPAKVAGDAIASGVKVANEIVILNDADMGTFAKANTGDGNFDIIITFGYLPVSLYTPGNAQVDGSVAELFLQGGDMIFNTADDIFYVTEGGGANGDAALKNITNTVLDLWTDGNVCTPTADGKKYAPSLPDSITAPRAFKLDQIEAEPDWDLDVAFATGTDGTMADPVIIRNNKNGGRVGIAFQVADDAQPRGAVMTEIINNYLGANVTAVKPAEKATSTWGSIKSF